MENNIKYKWNLEDIYDSINNLEEDIVVCNKILIAIEEYKGRLSESSNNLYDCYENLEKMYKILAKISGYATLKYHQNMGETSNLKLYKKIQNLQTDIQARTSFILPEITEIDDSILEKFISEDDKLKKYERLIRKIMKDKKHILSHEAEYVISKYSDVLDSMDNIYTTLSNVDLAFSKVLDEDGNELELSHAKYGKYMASKDKILRKNAFDSMYSEFEKYINTITEIYLNSVKKDAISSELKNYNSSLENAVYNDDSTKLVYDSLIETINDNISINHKYMKLKKKLLNLDEIHLYDMYVNSLEVEENDISYEESQNIIKKALEPLGKEYLEVIDIAFKNRWIDVYESNNKRSGAYSMDVYGVHPFILSNYTNDNESVSTIAHELGHTMHSYYASNNQNYFYSAYTILVAEVASTVNEILLSEYLINSEPDNLKKAALINSQIDRIRATLIRQTMFAEFEKSVHQKVEDNISLASEDLCDIYYDLNKKYFGDDVIIDEKIKYEWARIPHFYSSFYVYKYATGISSAICIANKILNDKGEYTKKYIDMLKAGGSKDSLDLLRSVDVDLETKDPVEDAIKYFENKINELESIVNNL